MPWPRCEIHKEWDVFECPICEADLEMWRREYRRLMERQGQK